MSDQNNSEDIDTADDSSTPHQSDEDDVPLPGPLRVTNGGGPGFASTSPAAIKPGPSTPPRCDSPRLRQLLTSPVKHLAMMVAPVRERVEGGGILAAMLTAAPVLPSGGMEGIPPALPILGVHVPSAVPQANPTDDNVPADPPGNGNIPANPSDGNIPANPGNGNIPANPADGNAPANPADGNAPANPADGNVPANPADGNVPANPADGNVPANPADGNVPANPADGNVPADPLADGNVPADPLADGNVPADPPADGNVPADPPAEGNVPADPPAEGNVPADPPAEGNFPEIPAGGNVPNDPPADVNVPPANLPEDDNIEANPHVDVNDPSANPLAGNNVVPEEQSPAGHNPLMVFPSVDNAPSTVDPAIKVSIDDILPKVSSVIEEGNASTAEAYSSAGVVAEVEKIPNPVAEEVDISVPEQGAEVATVSPKKVKIFHKPTEDVSSKPAQDAESTILTSAQTGNSADPQPTVERQKSTKESENTQGHVKYNVASTSEPSHVTQLVQTAKSKSVSEPSAVQDCNPDGNAPKVPESVQVDVKMDSDPVAPEIKIEGTKKQDEAKGQSVEQQLVDESPVSNACEEPEIKDNPSANTEKTETSSGDPQAMEIADPVQESSSLGTPFKKPNVTSKLHNVKGRMGDIKLEDSNVPESPKRRSARLQNLQRTHSESPSPKKERKNVRSATLDRVPPEEKSGTPRTRAQKGRVGSTSSNSEMEGSGDETARGKRLSRKDSKR